MQTYTAPVARHAVLPARAAWARNALNAIPRFSGLSPELIDSVLEAAATLATEVLLPINASGDVGRVHAGKRCRAHAGRFPCGLRGVSRKGGWPSIASDSEWGGQGLAGKPEQARGGDDLCGELVVQPVSRPDARGGAGAAGARQ